MSTELASGYISLSVRYASAMKQINADLMGLEATAKKAGTDAGQSLSASLAKSSKVDSGQAKKSLAGFEDAAKTSGTRAGEDLGSGLLSGARAKINAGAGDLTSGLKGKVGGSGKEAATGFVESFGGPIAALGTKAGPIGLALAASVGVAFGIGALIGKQVLAGMEQEQGKADVAAKFGFTPEQLKVVAEGAGKAYVGNFGESVQANMSTAGIAIQTGLIDPNASAADVQAVVQQLDTLSKITDEDTQALSKSAQQMVKTGLVDSYGQAFDLIAKGQQKGLNASGDLLDTFNEYSTQFRKLGIDGPTALGLINQGLQGGARDADLVADAIKEFSIRAIDGSKSTVSAYAQLGLSADDMAAKIAKGGPTAKAAFDQVVTSIKAIQDPVERNTVGVELFGTQWEDLGSAVNSLDVSTATAQLGAVDGALQKASDTMGGTTASSFESAQRTIEVAVDSMQQQLAGVLGPALQEVATWVSTHQAEIVGFFTGVAQAAIFAVGSVTDFAGDFLIAIGQLIAPIGDVLGAMNKFQAFQADFRGDHEEADRLRAEAEGYFAWGQGLEATGNKLKGFKDDLQKQSDQLGQNAAQNQRVADTLGLIKEGIFSMPDGKNIIVKDNSEESKKRLEDLGFAVTRLPDGRLTVRIDYKDANGQSINPDQLKVSQRQQSAAQGNEGPQKRPGFAKGRNGTVTGPGSGTSDSILAWLSDGEGVVTANAMSNGGATLVAALNAGWTPPVEMLRSMLPGLPGFAEGLNPGADFLRTQIMQLWPQIGTIGGRRSEDGYGEHSSGNAIDVMIPGWDTPQGKALGDAVASFVAQNKDALGANGMIWRQTSYGYGGDFTSGKGMSDRGSPTQNHMDHVHIILGAGRGAGAPSVDAPTQSLSLPSGGSVAPGSASSSSGGGAATAQQLSAAQDKVTDAQNRADTAQMALDEAKGKGTTGSALKSKQDAADKAKREADQAKTDLETLKNKAPDPTGSKGSASDNPFSQILSGVGQLGDLAKGGLIESLLPPGFNNPLDGSLFKSGAALLNFAGSLTNDPTAKSILGIASQAVGGSPSGVANGIGGLLMPQQQSVQPGDATVHPGSGALPGPIDPASFIPDPSGAAGGAVTNNDNSIHYAEGAQINQDATQVMAAAKRQQVAQQTPQLGTRRFI